MGLRKCAALVGDASVLAWQFDACRRRLEENRFVAGQNIPAESGRANDPFGQLPELIEDQAKRNVTIISVGGSPAVQADKMAASPPLSCLRPVIQSRFQRQAQPIVSVGSRYAIP